MKTMRHKQIKIILKVIWSISKKSNYSSVLRGLCMILYISPLLKKLK
jgi:hypothetical protein